MKKENNDIIYHYTSLDVLYQIIKGIQIKGLENDKPSHENMVINMRASHIFYMNDPTEHLYFVDCFIEGLKRYENDNGVPQISDKLYSTVMGFDNIISPYISSFSEHEDKLLMWRGYGKNGLGIALGFSKHELKKYLAESDTLVKVDNVSKEDLIRELFKRDEKIDGESIISSVHKSILSDEEEMKGCPHNILMFFLNNRPKYKSPDYEEEKEWRIIANRAEKKYFVRDNNLLVPYVDIQIPLKCLKKIYIGPCLNQTLNLRSIRDLFLYRFRKEGISLNNFIDIKLSQVSYRL